MLSLFPQTVRQLFRKFLQIFFICIIGIAVHGFQSMINPQTQPAANTTVGAFNLVIQHGYSGTVIDFFKNFCKITRRTAGDFQYIFQYVFL